jgi:putative copper resistance protein D
MMQPPLLQAVMTFLLNASFAAMVGVLAARFWLDRDGPPWKQVTLDRLSVAMGVAIVVGGTATLLSLWQAAATMGDVPLLQAGPALWANFVTTRYGQAGLVSLVVLATAALMHFSGVLSQRRILYEVAMTVTVVLYALCRVSIGHATENGPVSLAVAVELTHLLLMALWVGSVIVSGWLVLPNAPSAGPAKSSVTPYLASLSRWATVALAGILATGVYNAFRVLKSPGDLLGTSYGWILTTKLCFIAVAIGLGGWNRFYGFPVVAASHGPIQPTSRRMRPLIAVLRIESVALLVALAAAAVLTGSEPPGLS